MLLKRRIVLCGVQLKKKSNGYASDSASLGDVLASVDINKPDIQESNKNWQVSSHEQKTNKNKAGSKHYIHKQQQKAEERITEWVTSSDHLVEDVKFIVSLVLYQFKMAKQKLKTLLSKKGDKH